MDHKYLLNKTVFLVFCLVVFSSSLFSQKELEVRGLLLYPPRHNDVDEFVAFIDDVLAPSKVNTMILIMNYGYEFTSRPELKALDTYLTEEDVKKIVKICKKNNIRLIPRIDLLGHQSLRHIIGKLLKTYPEFDETPNIKLPEKWKWPNKDSLYAKSYCPRHPDIHNVLFDVIDELIDVFEADAFDGGMDEVLYIAHKDCPRCKGANPAEIFATEVKTIRNHLAEKGVEFWIAGDRLIDGPKTQIRFWEASYNGTHPAIDMIPKDVVIRDWHYRTAYRTPEMFAKKGFKVVSSTWNNTDVALQQVEMIKELKRNSSRKESQLYLGIIQSYWANTRSFMDGMKNRPVKNSSIVLDDSVNIKAIECFKTLIQHW